MAGVSNLVTICDEIEAMILALNDDLSYFAEGAEHIPFHLPRAHEGGDLESSTGYGGVTGESRRFAVLPYPGFDPGRWDGTEAPVLGVVLVLIRYRAPSLDIAGWRLVHRMASRDSEVIGHGIMTREWTTQIVGDIVPQLTAGLEDRGDGVFLARLGFLIEYHYDGS